jgi:hypothetical protein
VASPVRKRASTLLLVENPSLRAAVLLVVAATSEQAYGSWSSNAPMSHRAPDGLGSPR